MSFKPTLASFSAKASTSSSRSWLARQSRDPYVKSRSNENFRSRSAYKLLEINEKHGNFIQKDYVRTIVDLGSAPGGWSQVLTSLPLDPDGAKSKRKVKKREASGYNDDEPAALNQISSFGMNDPIAIPRLVVAVDILPMQPLPGVISMQGNFLDPKTQARIAYVLSHGRLPERGTSILASESTSASHSTLPDSQQPSAVRPESLTGKADAILSDIASNFTGNRLADCQSSLDVCTVVYEFCSRHLKTAAEAKAKRGGVLLLKHFEHPLLREFRSQYLDKGFHDVRFIKPNASRDDSAEGYWLCRGWKGAADGS